MQWFYPRYIEKNERENFYQEKFEYNKNVFRWVVILLSLSEITYFFTDCQIFGRFAYETVIPRFIVLVPLAIFLVYEKIHKRYFGNIVFSYMLMHICMWCTIWSIWFLPNRDFSREGFLAMQFGFLALGISSPYYLSTLLHALMFANLFVSNTFIHYEHFDMILTLGLPIFAGITLLLKVLENNYIDHYIDEKKLVELSFHDQLTGVYSRNILDKILLPGTMQLDFASAKRVWVLLFDIDYFKQVNDNYGHETGDKVLVMVSGIINENIKDTDYCLRWGGEEFVVFLQDASKESAADIAENVRIAVSESRKLDCAITISCGIAQYLGNDYHQAINDADKALYRAKENGRNRIEMKG